MNGFLCTFKFYNKYHLISCHKTDLTERFETIYPYFSRTYFVVTK